MDFLHLLLRGAAGKQQNSVTEADRLVLWNIIPVIYVCFVPVTLMFVSLTPNLKAGIKGG